MESTRNLLEPLLLKAETFSKTSIELIKLRSIERMADIASMLASRLLSVIVLSLFVLVFNIGIAFWIGDLLNKNYYGFLIVASFYLLLGVILLILHPGLKRRFNDFLISQTFKDHGEN